MATAIGYLRVSSEQQAESGAGLAAQRSAIETYAAKAGLEIVGWHEDAGISGSAAIEDRPGLLAAIGQLRRGSVLLIAKRDRIARDTFLSLVIEKTVGRRGAAIVSCDGLGNGDGPADAFMRSILSATAEFERGLIRQRTRSAMAEKRRRNERVGTIPFGWDLGADGRLIANDAEQLVIRRMLEARAAGLTLRAIANILNGESIPTKQGRSWYGESVRSVLERVAALAA